MSASESEPDPRLDPDPTSEADPKSEKTPDRPLHFLSRDAGAKATGSQDAGPRSKKDAYNPMALSAEAFGSDSLTARLRKASKQELNEAEFGVIKISEDGTVEFYNRFEESFSGLSAKSVLGSNFFREVAPCTKSRLFQGRFEKHLRKGTFDERFSYTFSYRLRPTLVTVRMLGSPNLGNWILVRPRAGART